MAGPILFNSSINDLEEGVNNVLINFAHCQEMGGLVKYLEQQNNTKVLEEL